MSVCLCVSLSVFLYIQSVSMYVCVCVFMVAEKAHGLGNRPYYLLGGCVLKIISHCICLKIGNG